MQRADERGPAEQPVRQGSPAVRAFSLRRKDAPVSPVKDRDLEWPDLEGPTLTLRYARERAQTNVLAHRAHPMTGSECRN